MKKLLLALALGLASMGAGADHKPGHEIVTLSYEECMSIGPALVQQVEGLTQDPAISQNAQKVVDDAAPIVRADLAKAEDEGVRQEMLNSLPTTIAFACLQTALMYGEIQVEIGADPE